MSWHRSRPKPSNVCPHCRQEKVGKHAHCSGCGVLLGQKDTVHSHECAVRGLQPGQFCPKCRKLLASGAWCPEHGNPMEVK